MTVTATRSTYASSAPHQGTFIAYINGIEVPAKSVSLRYGVWQMPEMQLEMVADPVLVRLGSEDRVQVAVFYLDDCDVDPSVEPTFRLLCEGEITGWGYRNTSSGRSIVFTVVNQIAIFTQLFVQFMTTIDDMVGPATGPEDTTGFENASSDLVYPYALFNQGLLPGQGQSPSIITRPFDYLYNVVKGMMASVVPSEFRTIPAANFFTRWARLTNFHNRFVASPFFDEATDNTNIFPVLKALQNTSAVTVINKDLLPNVGNAGSLWDMLQLVYQSMLMEITMIPGMPLVSVDLTTSLAKQTDFSEHKLVFDQTRAAGPAWVPALREASRKTTPKRLQNYFTKPQMFFSVPPSCNVMFPSQIMSIAYDENYATQPTRLYFNDEVLPTILKIPNTGLGQAVQNALAIAYPPQADFLSKARDQQHPRFNGKNFLIYPEEFFKGPVMDRREVPRWLFFLKQSELAAQGGAPTPDSAGGTTDAASAADQTTAAPQTANADQPPSPPPKVPPGTMVTGATNGKVGDDGARTYSYGVENLRTKIETATRATRVPSDFALAWISVVSNGERTATNSAGAKGIFQMRPEDARDLRSPGFPQGVNLDDLANDPENAIAIQAGLDWIALGRARVDDIKQGFDLGWTEADLWRLTKLYRTNPSSYVYDALNDAQDVLGHPPVDWAEFYRVASDSADEAQMRALNDATATGVLPGATGTMTSASDPVPFTAGAPRPAPAAPAAAAPSSDAPTETSSAPDIDAGTISDIDANVEDVYHLYAKFEYFRERYARRSGSANVTWNPYVVPGFPGVLFDQRASRVDLVVYFTTVQLSLSNDGRRSTALSFMYGRQFQEMFDVLRQEFAQNNATARGSGPQEPIRDISKITQSFVQAESYYQRLFYGSQRLYDKDAAFDFRRVIGMAPTVAGNPPEEIFVDGPEAATQDAAVAAAQALVTLLAERNTVNSTLLDVRSRIKTQREQVIQEQANINGNQASTETQQTFTDAQAELRDLVFQANALTARVESLNVRIKDQQNILEAPLPQGQGSAVTHNLDDAIVRELVPLPATQELFDSRDAATRYNWRPICTLDEYIVFYDVAGEGTVPAFGHERSVGARFFERIRHMTAPAANFTPPAGVDGLGTSANTPGISTESFPQTRASWDDALIAYRNNVLHVKAPRT